VISVCVVARIRITVTSDVPRLGLRSSHIFDSVLRLDWLYPAGFFVLNGSKNLKVE